MRAVCSEKCCTCALLQAEADVCAQRVALIVGGAVKTLLQCVPDSVDHRHLMMYLCPGTLLQGAAKRDEA